MFELHFDDCGIAQPDGTEIGSFDGTAHYGVEDGMAFLTDIEIKQFHPDKPPEKCFSMKMLNRFDSHELWMLNGIGVSIKRQYEQTINEKIEEEIASRSPPSSAWLYANSAGRSL